MKWDLVLGRPRVKAAVLSGVVKCAGANFMVVLVRRTTPRVDPDVSPKTVGAGTASSGPAWRFTVPLAVRRCLKGKGENFSCGRG